MPLTDVAIQPLLALHLRIYGLFLSFGLGTPCWDALDALSPNDRQQHPRRDGGADDPGDIRPHSVHEQEVLGIGL